jgi:hypothetical protein
MERNGLDSTQSVERGVSTLLVVRRMTSSGFPDIPLSNVYSACIAMSSLCLHARCDPQKAAD